MRKHLGSSLLWLFFLLPLCLGAQTTYRWHVEQSKAEAVQSEAVIVEYTCQFDTEGYEYIIEFDPLKETQKYRLVLESAIQRIIDLKRVNTYRFILFPKQAGELRLELNATMQHTSKASIENTVIGRDNVQKIDYLSKTVALPVAAVSVHANDSGFAGHLRLSVVADKTRVDAYAPVQLRIRLEGYGNLDRIPPFALDLPGVKQFSDGEEKTLTKDEKGFEGSIVQQFALVSEGNFTIPALHFRYFDTEQNRVRLLTTEPIEIDVNPPEMKATQTVADTDTNTSESSGLFWLEIVLTLIAGIVIGRFLIPVETPEAEGEPLLKRLKSCRDPEQFAAYLAMLDAVRHRDMIDEIEGKLGRGEKVDLGAYKKRL